MRNTRYKIRDTLHGRAFSLIEVVVALGILALISSSVLVVINRCVTSAADSAQRYQAFEVARDNMEALLSKNSVKEMAEFGSSDKYPGIQWQTVVETFYEPITARMWIQAICSAEYTDTAGNLQTIELTHWLTDLTKKQLLQIMEERKKEKERLAEEGEEEKDEDRPDEPNEPNKPDEPNEPNKPDEQDDEEKICGYTWEELYQMDPDQVWEILWNCDEF